MSTRNRQIQSRHFTGADTMALPQTLGDHHAPENVREAQTMARQWHRDSLLVGSGIRAQVAFAATKIADAAHLRPGPRETTG